MMAGLFVNLADGQLEIEGQTAGFIAMKCPAWCALTLIDFLEYGDRTGADKRLPRGTTRAYRRRQASKQVSIPFDITGEVDSSGGLLDNADDNYWNGFAINYRFLRDELVADPGTVDGLRAGRYTSPDGHITAGQVHVLAIPVGNHENGVAACTLDLIIKDGMFT